MITFYTLLACPVILQSEIAEIIGVGERHEVTFILHPTMCFLLYFHDLISINHLKCKYKV